MSAQTTSHLLMIRPVQFAFNTQTAVNNAFQSTQDTNAQELALTEFDNFVTLLRQNGIDVTVVNDTPEPHTPDSIFPNNWISFHDDGSVVLYPMYAVNRRQERKPHVLEQLQKQFVIHHRVDLSPYENKDIFLEGTGSMVLDRENKIAYACLSQRTDANVLKEFCAKLGYTSQAFTATDANGYPIYHTNVMMCVADQYVVICLDSIPDATERKATVEAISKTGKTIIDITLDQMNHFAGNMLQVNNEAGKKFLIMSSQAFRALSAEQVSAIETFNPIIHSNLDTIERNGGGSARCMMAEVFLPVKA
ncbi:citrulline utilization hydrolase CtlX [Chryseolinea lacunae]|uniref:Amidinotransferase n=1 Tax=Chryseolinea lacunae TaxID=2801331 RepID=A0ABS1KWP5_9BACT|nr:arginine deiminase-related protein [Chryseolinea lacunae]MBL0743637.1 amidinotransferase [Chryseolinea lacunae]